MNKLYYAVIAICLLFTACKKDDKNAIQAPLAIKSFWPNSGNAGTIVTITGSGFSTTLLENEVLFNGVKAQIMDARDTIIKVLAPQDATSGLVTLLTNEKKTDVGNYTFQNLSLSGIFPVNGPAGTNVSIKGLGFTSLKEPAKVFINGKEAVITSSNDSLLVAAVPVNAGSGKIVVIVDGKEVAGPDFLFQNITAIKPMTGGAGTRVTISGEGFSTNLTSNLVLFNGKQAKVIEATTSEIVVLAPDALTTGPVTVSINEQQTVGSTFTVVPFPIIQSVAPLSGPIGTDVTIKGEYFSNFADEVVVTFNGATATISTATDKSIVVKVPGNATSGIIQLTVNDQKVDGPTFKVQNLGVALLSPDNGMDGDIIKVNGLGFSKTASDNKVFFNGIAATVTAATATELTVTVPAGFTTGPLTINVGALSATGPVFGRAGVITLAGSPTSTDLQGLNGIAVDSKGNVFVVTGNMIKKISPAGVISNFAGSSVAGYLDATGESARFNYLSGVAVDEQDNIYASDQFNGRIRKITQAGVVTTAGTISTPISISSDPSGNIYVGQNYNGVFQLNKATGATTKVTNAMYETGDFIAALSPANLFYAMSYDENPRVYRVLNGVKSFYAGSSWGFTDGTYTSAQFRSVTGLAVTVDGVVYALDNATIRRMAEGRLTTLIGINTAGQPAPGYVDGGLKDARLSSQSKNMCIDKQGNLYVADVGNRSVRKIFFK